MEAELVAPTQGSLAGQRGAAAPVNRQTTVLQAGLRHCVSCAGHRGGMSNRAGVEARLMVPTQRSLVT